MMLCKAAVTFIRCGDWMAALQCLELVSDEKLRTGEGFDPPQLDAYQTLRDFLMPARVLLSAGIALLASLPHFYISITEAEEISDAFDSWFDQKRQSVWPQVSECADAEPLGPGRLWDVVQDEMYGPAYYSSLSRFELDNCLWLYISSSTSPPDDPTSADQPSLPPALHDGLYHLVSNIIAWCVSERTAASPAYANLHLYPLPPLPYFTALALQSCAYELAEAGLAAELAPSVNWERLARVVEGWVKERMNFASGDDAAGEFLRVLAAVYEGERSVAAEPSRKNFEEVIGMFVGGQQFLSTQVRERNAYDAQVLKMTMEVLLPGLANA
jgi:hypothetical protein